MNILYIYIVYIYTYMNAEKENKMHILTFIKELKEWGEAENKEKQFHDKYYIHGDIFIYFIILWDTIIKPNYK